MPRLLSDPASAVGQAEFAIRQVRTTIGRRSYNDIVLNHRSVSGEHALLRREGLDIYLEDLGSTNGSFVNGRLIKRQRLAHNDTIEIGGCVLRYVADEALDSPAWTPRRAPPFASQRGPEASASATLPLWLGSPTSKVQVLTGDAAGQELALTKVVTTIGKPGVLLVSITRRPSGCVIAYVDGHGRPVVNGLEMAADVMPLQDGDVIELAGTQMKFMGG
jgi:hypothetical protein